MALNLPTTDPAQDYYRPLSNGRVILVENTDLPWSVALTRKYARRKRIPASNIVSVAMGTNLSTWTPASNAAFRTAFLVPILEVLDDVLGQAVLMGPGTPDQVLLRNKLTIGSSYQLTTTGAVVLSSMAASVRQIDANYQTYGINGLCFTTDAGGNLPYVGAYPATTGSAVCGGNWVYSLLAVGALPYPDYGTLYEGLNAETIILPNQAAIDLLGAASNYSVLRGKIGIGWTTQAYSYDGYDNVASYAETAEMAGRAMERATRYAEAVSPDNRYQQPIHFQFNSYTTTAARSTAYLHSQLLGWGYQSSYAWRTSNTTSDTELYAPYSGTAYSQAALDAGRVRDRPYHLMVGDASNLEMPAEPYASAWKPTAGGGVWIGPSEGWIYALHSVAKRGGSGGYSNARHVSASVYTSAYSIVHNLLRGMTWAEAMYFSTYSVDGNMLPIGDPLARPFPRD